MIEDAPNNNSYKSSDNQEDKQIETDVPNTFLQPHWPQSKTHQCNDDDNNQDEVE
jgi:hypothetical protein